MVRTEINAPAKRQYAYRRITAPTPKPEPTAKLSYLYIGNRFRSAHDLHQGFDLSHFVFAPAEAINLLGRLQKSNRLPDVILLDGEFEPEAFARFMEVIGKDEIFRQIPVLAEVSGLRDELIVKLSVQKGVTDLVRVTGPDSLLRKTMFCRKLEKAEPLNSANVESGMNPIQLSRYLSIRAFDVLFSAICIFLLSPLMLIFGLLIRLSGSTEIFEFTSERGLRYKSFRYMRFRTDAALQVKQVPDFCSANHLSIGDTEKLAFHQSRQQGSNRLGAFLQATNLDELPALFNIFVGDISFLKHR